MKKSGVEICKVTTVHHRRVDRVTDRLPKERHITDLAETFKVLSDPTRLRIVLALSMEELCVCDLATVVKLSVSAVSHQLRLLKGHKLVAYRKQGKQVYYRLDDDHVINLINEAASHVQE
jgi:ArsR family transcriptional regulator